MNARRVNAAAGVILAAQKQRQTATGIAAALEAAGLLQSPESAASPWERAVAGLNALVDADVIFHVEPDGHISAPFSDEHIEWDLKAKRWVLTRDEDDDSYEAAADRYLATSYADDNPRPTPDAEHLAVVAARWNSLYPVGTPVTAYPGHCVPRVPSRGRLEVHPARDPHSECGVGPGRPHGGRLGRGAQRLHQPHARRPASGRCVVNGWQIVAGSTAAYALCAIALVLVVDGHHPITHLVELLHRLGGHR